jgi:hypothetical protein
MIKEGGGPMFRPAIGRYFFRRRRRLTRIGIEIVTAITIVMAVPMVKDIGASFPPKRWITGPVATRAGSFRTP